MTKLELEDLQNTSIDELYAIIGNSLESEGKYVSAPKKNKTKLADKARKWLFYMRKDLSSAVCSNDKIKDLMLNKKSDRLLTLVTAIADAISSLVLPAPPFVVGILLIKEGIYSPCPEFENE
jgi:hypothetical protein